MKKTLIILGSVLLCVLLVVVGINVIDRGPGGGGDPGANTNNPVGYPPAAPGNSNTGQPPPPGEEELADEKEKDKEKDDTDKKDQPESPGGKTGGTSIKAKANGKVTEKNDEAQLNSSPLEINVGTDMHAGDDITTNPLGVAILRFLECEDKSYVFEDSELSLEGCPDAERKNSKLTCVRRGLAAFKHTATCTIQSLVQSPNMASRALGTWYAVAVRPKESSGEQRSLLLVFKDSVELAPVRRIDSRGRFVFAAETVTVPSGNLAITRIGDTAGTTVGIPERQVVPFPTTYEEAKSLYDYFDLTPKKLNSLFDQAWDDLGPASTPVLPVPPPTISVSSIDFQNINRRNVYYADLTIRNDSVYLVAVWEASRDSNFETGLTAPTEIKPSDVLKVRVRLSPLDTGALRTKMIFRHTAEKDGTLEVDLTAVTARTERIDFGEQVVGEESEEIPVEITQPVPLVIDKSDAGLEQFKIDDTECVKAAPGAPCAIGIRFAPNKIGGSYPSFSITSGNLLIPGNFVIGTRTIELAGLGVSAPVVRVSKDSVNFGKRKPQDKSDPELITVTVGKPRRLNLELSGPAKDQFAIENNTCKDTVVDQKCSFNVVFNSTVDGTYLADVKISSAEPNETFSTKVELKGVVEGTPTIGYNARLCFKRAKVVKGDKQVNASEQQTFDIKSDGDSPLVIGDVSISDGNDFKIVENNCKGKIDTACRIVVGFTPRATKSRESYLVIKHNGNKSRETRIPLRGVGKPRNPIDRFFKKLSGYEKETCS